MLGDAIFIFCIRGFTAYIFDKSYAAFDAEFPVFAVLLNDYLTRYSPGAVPPLLASLGSL